MSQKTMEPIAKKDLYWFPLMVPWRVTIPKKLAAGFGSTPDPYHVGFEVNEPRNILNYYGLLS